MMVNAVWKCLPRCSPHANDLQLFFLANVPHLLWALSSVSFVSIKAFVRVQIKRIFKIQDTHFQFNKVVYRKAIKKRVRRENLNISNMHVSILFIFLLSFKILPSSKIGCCNGTSSLGRGCGYTRCMCNWRSLRSLDRTILEFWIRSCDMRWSGC